MLLVLYSEAGVVVGGFPIGESAPRYAKLKLARCGLMCSMHAS